MFMRTFVMCLLQFCANFFLTMTLWSGFYYYSHFSDEGSNSENINNIQDQRVACEPGHLARSPEDLSLLFLRSVTFSQHRLPGLLSVLSANTLSPMSAFSEILSELHNLSP